MGKRVFDELGDWQGREGGVIGDHNGRFSKKVTRTNKTKSTITRTFSILSQITDYLWNTVYFTVNKIQG